MFFARHGLALQSMESHGFTERISRIDQDDFQMQLLHSAARKLFEKPMRLLNREELSTVIVVPIDEPFIVPHDSGDYGRSGKHRPSVP